MTTGRGLALARESALEAVAWLPPLESEMRGSLSLVRPRPRDGLLPRPEDALDELPLAEDFVLIRALVLEAAFDELLEAVLDPDLEPRAFLLFVLAVDFVDWRAMS